MNENIVNIEPKSVWRQISDPPVAFSAFSQILSPHDVGIQESILKSLAPEGDNVFSDDLSPYGDLVIDPMQKTSTDYYSYIEGSLYDKEGLNESFEGRPLVYTAMHGVGADFIDKVYKHTPSLYHIDCPT